MGATWGLGMWTPISPPLLSPPLPSPLLSRVPWSNLIDEMIFLFRGDVVVLRSPIDPTQFLCKRVTGMEFDDIPANKWKFLRTKLVSTHRLLCKAKSYYMVSPQTVFTYPFHHAKLQILLHGVTANSLYLSLSPCKATNLTTWCHRKQSLLIPFTMQSYKSYYMVSPQTVFTYPCHHAKLQILLHGVTANSLYLSFSPCNATNLTTWYHRKQSLLILFTMQCYKSYYMVSPQTVFTYPLHHAKLQILLISNVDKTAFKSMLKTLLESRLTLNIIFVKMH